MASSFANPVQVYAAFEDAHWWYRARRRIVTPLLESLVAPGGTVVDVGCGGGANLAALVGTYRCVGIDISQDLVEAGRRRFPQVEFITGNAPDDLGAHASTADAFLLMDVIEHIRDDLRYFERLFHASRVGAVFVITVPAEPALWSPHDDAVGHQRRYTPATLAALWEPLAAEQLLLGFFNCRLYPVIRGARAINRRRGRVTGRSGTDFAMPPFPLNAVLAAIMGSERHRLLDLLHGRTAAGFPRGVSLAAVLRKVGSSASTGGG